MLLGRSLTEVCFMLYFTFWSSINSFAKTQYLIGTMQFPIIAGNSKGIMEKLVLQISYMQENIVEAYVALSKFLSQKKPIHLSATQSFHEVDKSNVP